MQKNTKSPKILISLTVVLFLAVASAGGFLVLKDKKIGLEKIKQEKQLSKIETSASLIKTTLPDKFDKDKAKEAEKNLTENMGQRLAATALATNFDPVEIENNPEIIERTLAGIDGYFALPEISDDEIQISNDNSENAIKSYIFSMSDALSYGAMPIEYYEELQQTGLENIDPETLPKIEQLLKDYQKSIKEIKKIKTPYSWKEIHKEQISILILTANLLKAITQNEQDPLKAELALQKLEQVPDFMNQLEEKMLNLMQEQQLFSDYSS